MYGEKWVVLRLVNCVIAWLEEDSDKRNPSDFYIQKRDMKIIELQGT